MSESLRRIGWIDSVGLPSHIHLTCVDNPDNTICKGHKEHIANRKLTKVPKKRSGHSNYCVVCFKNGYKSVPWDERCEEYYGHEGKTYVEVFKKNSR
jgi:hypothetical protein